MIDPYKGRPKPRSSGKADGNQSLRMASKGTDPSAVQKGQYDVTDPWLRGHQVNPFSAAHVAPRKK